MKKATLYLLMISLIGMLEVPVHAADVYADESTELYSFDEGAMCDDDFATECQADVSDKKLQQDFESAMKDGIGLGLDDFLETRLLQSHTIHPECMQWEIAKRYRKRVENCIHMFSGLG